MASKSSFHLGLWFEMFLREVVSETGPVLFSFFIIDVGQVMECLFHLTSAGETRLSVDYQVIQQWQDCRCKLKWGLSGYREKFFPHEDSQAVNTAHRNCTVSTFGRFPSSNWSCSWAVWSYPLAGLDLSSKLDERHAESFPAWCTLWSVLYWSVTLGKYGRNQWKE